VPAAPAWPAIEDHAIIGDCRTAGLVSREGSITWLCLPDFSSPSVFGEILDRQTGGVCRIRPRGKFTVLCRYIANTPVLETVFETAQGAARVVDLLPVLDGVGTLQPMREILRIIDGLSGELDLEIRIEPQPNYGRTKPQIKNRGRLGWSYSWSNELLTVRSDVDLARVGDALQSTVRVCAGERICLSLCYAKADIGVLSLLGRAATERLERTTKWWQGWTDRCSYEGLYKEAVQRSALPAVPGRHFLSRKPEMGAYSWVRALHHRRLAVRISVLFSVC
jgi:GH15 family glucan-1,4-alpha-glucosidase